MKPGLNFMIICRCSNLQLELKKKKMSFFLSAGVVLPAQTVLLTQYMDI